ncbi:MAG: DUF2306 domain-containing protein [Candidatus Methylopumilus sp.]|jgi:uncharacterized membrane protein|nr:DUF2306 domain-containing protein [Candidatus Methylopumilus sp.]
MNLALLASASPAIIIHLIFAIAAFVLGGIQLASRKGTRTHKLLGYVWVAAMVVICLTSFKIKEVMPQGMFGGYSPIHLLSVFVLFQLARGIYFAKKKNIKKHRKCMLFTYIGGLVIAGVFTFMPGRFLFKVLIEPWF